MNGVTLRCVLCGAEGWRLMCLFQHVGLVHVLSVLWCWAQGRLVVVSLLGVHALGLGCHFVGCRGSRKL